MVFHSCNRTSLRESYLILIVPQGGMEGVLLPQFNGGGP